MHENKYCERCGNVFECKVGSIGICQCSIIVLTLEEQSFIDSKYSDCLCIECLHEMKKKYSISTLVSNKANKSGNDE